MTLLRTLAIAVIALAVAPVIGDEPQTPTTDTASATAQAPTTVTIASRGLDVREVLHDLFTQAGKDYLLEEMPRTNLFLSLRDTSFEEALLLICSRAGLSFELQNGVYHIKRRPAPRPTPTASQAKPQRPNPTATNGTPKTSEAARPAPSTTPSRPRLGEALLQRRLTTRLSKIPLRDLMADITRQTGVTIRLDPSIPGYRVDAFLLNTSLKYALDMITRAARLTYRLNPDDTITILPNPESNRVTLVDGP